MPIRTTRRSPGEPTWMDLGTYDLAKATEFFRKVFGWTYEDTGAEFGHYHLAMKDGHNAVGIAAMDPSGQLPSAWTIYFASDDVAADAQRVTDLGGQVVMEPMTVGDLGRMAICIDPTGAGFGLWQAINHIGAGIDAEPGSMTWCEVNTWDAAAACDFYGELLQFSPQKMEDMDYYMLMQGDKAYCGVLQMDENWEGIPPHWMGYFAVENADASLKRVEEAGGQIRVPAFDSAYGRIAVVADPGGAHFSIVQMNQDQTT